MRDIKFRAWDIQNQEMTSAPMRNIYRNKYSLFGDIYLLQKEMFKDTVRVELMQYTGLKDKNDVEIYEGDIVNVNHCGGTPRYEKVKFYANAGFASVHPFTDSGHHWSSYRCEIVGNIYENKDLLFNR